MRRSSTLSSGELYVTCDEGLKGSGWTTKAHEPERSWIKLCLSTFSVTAVTRVHLLSSGFHLGLSGLPQLSGLRMDARTSPPGRQGGFVSRRGHSDASAAVAEEEKLPNAPHRQLNDRSDKLRPSRCFSVACSKDRRGRSELSLSLRGKAP